MTTYRYIELYNNQYSADGGDGKLYFGLKPDPALLEELDAKVDKVYNKLDTPKPYTTLVKMGQLGWELKFVTPTFFHGNSENKTNGPILKSYIFAKADA